MNTWDVCQRCFTTHPLNERNERLCPKPPTEKTEGDGPKIIFKGGGWYCKDSVKINSPSDVM